jgi:hypothetical protein
MACGRIQRIYDVDRIQVRRVISTTSDSAGYTIHYTPYTIHYTLYSIHYTLYTIHCTLYTILYTLYTIHYTLYTKHHTPYTIHYTLSTIHYPPYSLYTIHYTLYTILVPSRCLWVSGAVMVVWTFLAPHPHYREHPALTGL